MFDDPLQDDGDEEEAVLDSLEGGSALDLIPDPDKIYGTENSSSDEDSVDDNR